MDGLIEHLRREIAEIQQDDLTGPRPHLVGLLMKALACAKMAIEALDAKNTSP